MRTGKITLLGILLLCCFIRMVIGEPCTVPSGEHGADVALRRSALD